MINVYINNYKTVHFFEFLTYAQSLINNEIKQWLEF